MSEFRGLGTTITSGSLASLAGAAVAVVFSASIADAEMLGFHYNSTLMGVFAFGGFILGPWVALRRFGFPLAEVTSALAVVWMLLLFFTVGPIFDAVGPPWLLLTLILAALAIARMITAPLARFVEPVPARSDKEPTAAL